MKKQKTNRVLMLLITFLNVFAVFAESGKIPDPPEQVNDNTPCYLGDFMFYSQAQIDAFGATYSGCTDITLGNVLISGGDITNLNGLSQLSHVTGYFKIAGSSLQNLNGLNNLQSIGGFLEFFDNAQLQNLNGLNALTSVGDYLNIYGNSALTNTEALASLTHIGTYLTIYNNHQLTNIDGLSSIQHLSGYLYVGYNAVLQNLSGLSNLQTVGSLNIVSNPALSNIGLNALQTTGPLDINSNPALTNLDGLSGLQNVLGHLKITNNATLSDISGLENIVQITGGMDGLNIINNPMLATCDIPSFCSYNLYSDISGNLPACNSLANIHASCVDCQTVTEVSAVPGATTVQISWTANNSETEWEIVWGTVGFDYENATPQIVSETPEFTIENLISGTAYEVYVKAICNEFSESEWSAVSNFTTLCPSGDYTFTTQAAIDAFGVTYSGCTDIVLGNLTISGGTINNLNGLSGIVTVTGNLTINYTPLVNLQGLNNLESVGGVFAFHDNGLFDDFTGLNNLESIGMGFSVYINGNASGTFEDFNGLDSLVSIGEGFYIAYNHHLKNFEGLTQLNSIGGALYIQYNENPGFVNLQGLESLQTVSQDVVVEHQHQFQSLQGLDGLTTIGRDLNIRSCQGLQQFSGLNALESIARDCNIHLNGALQNINGLNGLQTINGSLNIYSNGGLQSINGFNGLQIINGNLNIYSNQALQSLNGLNSLETINGFLSIYNHVTLQQLDGLEELSSVGSFVHIITNPQLQNLNGLANLTSIGGVLTIDNNNALTDISGLENITVFGTGLNITNNSNLSVCDLPNFCTYLSDVSNPRNISDNAEYCVSNAMVLTICSGSTCLSPTYLSHTQLNITSAELSWTSTGSLFDLEWGTQGFTQGSGTVVTDVATTTYQVTGLTSNLVYEFYVRQNCSADGESFWEGPYSFSVGYCSSVPTSNDSNGITNVSLGSTNFPVADVTYYYYTGSIIDIQAGTNVASAVTFATGFTYDTNIWIDLNDDGIFDSSELVFDGMSTNANPTTLNTSFYLDALANLGQHKMRIGTADLGQAIPNPCYSGAWGVTVDLMVNVTAAPFCIAPLELSHTQLSTTSAELSWISTGSLFNIEWGLQGFVKGTGTVISGISAPFYQLTGLTEHTVYEFYVRQDCGADEDIIWSDPYSFSVGYCIPVATTPASLDFDIYIHSVITTGGATNINNTGSGYSVNGFGNFSATHFASQYQGQGLSFSVAKSVGSSNNPVGIRIWLDWNNDGVFADSEIIYTSPTNHAGTHSGSFQIPINQLVGNYRMRVIMMFNPTNLNSCDNTNQGSDFGEVEDYTLTVLADLSGNCESFTIWNGTSWSNGVPDANKKAVIEGDLTITTALTACELLLNSGVLTVNPDVTLMVNGQIVNTQTAENFIVASDGVLIQVEDVENTGVITVKRNSTPMKRLDYTLWSSPVDEMLLKDFSEVSNTGGIGTIYNRVYTLGEMAWEQVWNSFGEVEAGSDTFTEAKGYLYRSRNDYHSVNTVVFEGIFEGVPQNGAISINAPYKFNAIGNPYPSPIDANEILTNGASALYFWTNTNAPDQSGTYQLNNWATYSYPMGGVSADGVKTPDGIIQTAQGFVIGFETADPNRQVIFDNDMRVNTHNGQFFKQINKERHRFWLNLSDEVVTYNQILVGYIENATQGEDTGIDAQMFAYEGNAIYSIIENSEEKFVIQGRELPFTDTDVVKLGFRAVNAGSFGISLNNFDGIFEQGNTIIYLKDNFNQTQHNLNNGAYTFVSEEGIFNNRFEIIYQTTMSVENPDINNTDWIVFKQNSGFQILTQGFELKEVSVYDILGRTIYTSKAEGQTHQIPTLGAEGVYIVKITTTEGKVLNKKVK